MSNAGHENGRTSHRVRRWREPAVNESLREYETGDQRASTSERTFCVQPPEGPWTMPPRCVDSSPPNVDEPPPNVDDHDATENCRNNHMLRCDSPVHHYMLWWRA